MLPFERSKNSLCHLCFRFATNPNNDIVYKTCARKSCSKIYCIDCVWKHFDKEITLEKFKQTVAWDCYSCLNICNCSLCNGNKIIRDVYDNGEKLKSISNQQQQQNQHQNQQQNHQPNQQPNQQLNQQPNHQLVSMKDCQPMRIQLRQKVQYGVSDDDQQNRNRHNIESSEEFVPKHSSINQPKKSLNRPLKQQIDYFEQLKQEMHSPFQNSSQINYSQYQQKQKKSRGISKSKKERSLMGLKNDKRIPPYMESIMKRKEVFRNFMLKHSGKSYEQLLRQQFDASNNTQKTPIQQSQSFIQIGQKTPVYEKQNFNQFQSQSYPSPVMKPSFSSNSGVEQFSSPLNMPQTPSFLPVNEPFTPVCSTMKLSDLLNEQLKEYEMEEDDLSLQLL